MLTTYIAAAIKRDLKALSREIRAFPDDGSLWLTPPGVTNSSGTLALHLTGNLQHFVGAILGGSGYRRNRPEEFSRRGVSREELARLVEHTITVVEPVLPRLTTEQLEADFPEKVGGQTIRTDEFLVHLVTHLAYHLGQLDYHRRLVTGQAGQIDAVSVKGLSTARGC